MKKRILCLLFALLILTAFVPNISMAEEPIKLWINGSYVETDVNPIIENGRTLVPVRIISESLGYEVEWHEEAQMVSVMKLDVINERIEKFISLIIDDTNVFDFDIDFATTLLNKELRGEETTDLDFSQLIETAKKIRIDVAPKIINGRTMIPIRFIAEEFGQKIDWDNENKTVVIGEGYNPSKKQSEISNNSFQEKIVVNPDIGQEFIADTRQGVIKGNKKSGIYHIPGGASYNKISVNNVVYFETEEEAQAAGYRKALN